MTTLASRPHYARRVPRARRPARVRAHARRGGRAAAARLSTAPRRNHGALPRRRRPRRDHGFGLPGHVERSFRRYLDCGVLARGFARVRCAACHYEVLVPFSCKARGLCPSCDGRRMADTAAHLVDRVLPSADYRQWTLSFPRWLRIRLLRADSRNLGEETQGA